MKSPILTPLLFLVCVSHNFAQNWPNQIRAAFISNLVTSTIDPRCNLGRPDGAKPGSLEFAFYYPDTCILHNRPYLRQQKDNLRRFTWSFMGRDSMQGYAFADFAFFDKPDTRQPLEMWREYYPPDYQDSLLTPRQRLDALTAILPFYAAATLTDSSIELTMIEKASFIPRFSTKPRSQSYTKNGYINFLAAIIYYYVLEQRAVVTNIRYIDLKGNATDKRYDVDTHYDEILPLP